MGENKSRRGVIQRGGLFGIREKGVRTNNIKEYNMDPDGGNGVLLE